jgi:hypothetical protein
MESASTSETSVNFYKTTQLNTSEESHLHTRCRDNLKSHQLERNKCVEIISLCSLPSRYSAQRAVSRSNHIQSKLTVPAAGSNSGLLSGNVKPTGYSIRHLVSYLILWLTECLNSYMCIVLILINTQIKRHKNKPLCVSKGWMAGIRIPTGMFFSPQLYANQFRGPTAFCLTVTGG